MDVNLILAEHTPEKGSFVVCVCLSVGGCGSTNEDISYGSGFTRQAGQEDEGSSYDPRERNQPNWYGFFLTSNETLVLLFSSDPSDE